MGLKAAVGQLALMGLILSGCVVYTRHHVTSLQRADFGGLEHFEDSKAGNGTRYRVLQRPTAAAETFTVEVLSRAGVPGFLPDLSGSTPQHSHTQGQEEIVTVLQGKLGYVMGMKDSKSGELAAGESLTIAAGKIHALYNADNSSDLAYTLSHTPAGPMGEAFFENLAGLGWDYGSVDRIHPLQVLVLFDSSGTQLSDLGGLLAPVVDKVLLPVARALGFRAHYPSHSTKGRGEDSSSSSSSDGSERGHEEL